MLNHLLNDNEHQLHCDKKNQPMMMLLFLQLHCVKDFYLAIAQQDWPYELQEVELLQLILHQKELFSLHNFYLDLLYTQGAAVQLHDHQKRNSDAEENIIQVILKH